MHPHDMNEMGIEDLQGPSNSHHNLHQQQEEEDDESSEEEGGDESYIWDELAKVRAGRPCPDGLAPRPPL